ncbi:MAG TPA: hypothetical protein VJV78_20295, partial [Polyangiales bacterium]|nr:hypothetical protein [Polyangiales bacterium]
MAWIGCSPEEQGTTPVLGSGGSGSTATGGIAGRGAAAALPGAAGTGASQGRAGAAAMPPNTGALPPPN